MKRGSEGIAGGGIYFADEAAKTEGKAHSKDFLFKCRVKLGRQQRWTTHRAHNPSYADRHTSFRSLVRENLDSVFIPRGGGDECVAGAAKCDFITTTNDRLRCDVNRVPAVTLCAPCEHTAIDAYVCMPQECATPRRILNACQCIPGTPGTLCTRAARWSSSRWRA